MHLALHVSWNGEWFGHPRGDAMHFHFGQLIAHAARTRRLAAGTIIGSGTVSNDSPGVGSACIAEKRVIEIIESGAPLTPFMKFDDTVQMKALLPDGSAPFGAIEQRVVKSS